MCLYTHDIQAKFPDDEWLAAVDAESYMAIPFVDTDGNRVGHMAVIHDRPIAAELFDDSLFRIFAAQAGAELLRRRAEQARLQMERQLLDARKLESLGVLAGGIAHDFNNLLSGIIGNVSLAKLDASDEVAVLPYLGEIELAAERAADLANEMPAYTGKGRFVVSETDLGILVEEVGNLLRGSIPKSTLLRCDLAHDLPPTQVDATQIRQVVMNLVLNAADATIGRADGVISLRTGVVSLGRDDLGDACVGHELRAGEYVFLEVGDNGIGMDDATRARIFDPFYTAKPTGRGLGLAAVQGIVRGHCGALSVESARGRGSTFTLMLRAHEGRASCDRPDMQTSPRLASGGSELVVDDEAILRKVTAGMLARMGFDVELAGDGQQGIELFRASPKAFDVVLLDLSMPHLSGEETFLRMRRINPDVRVILMSGYDEEDARGRFAGENLAGFLAKPFNADQLEAVLHSVMT